MTTLDPLRGSATISDLDFVRAIAKLRVWTGGTQGHYRWVMIWDLAAELKIHPNRVRSKLRRAHKRKLVDGCSCGCRGDFELLPAGEKLLREGRMTVLELIRKLSYMPSDAKVYMSFDDGLGSGRVLGVKIDEDGDVVVEGE